MKRIGSVTLALLLGITQVEAAKVEAKVEAKAMAKVETKA